VRGLDEENGERETAEENRGDDNLFPDKKCVHVQGLPGNRGKGCASGRPEHYLSGAAVLSVTTEDIRLRANAPYRYMRSHFSLVRKTD